MKEKPPWIKDSISISDKAKRLQGLCDDEIERRRKRRGIQREHWKYVGLEEPTPKQTNWERLNEKVDPIRAAAALFAIAIGSALIFALDEIRRIE